ncbi:MAG: hypothetical protein ACT443_05985 [Gemmatimonadota bacterium]
MPSIRPACLIVLLCATGIVPSRAHAQHEHAGHDGMQFAAGAHGVALITHTTPAIQGRALTEGYLTQPSLSAELTAGRLELRGMLNLEGLTLERGELNHGVWGEGYIDRRHPHTYLHEAMLIYSPRVFGTDLSISVGRGFAPFGTDDPMARGFVKYPANHHLAQILERLVAIGAVRRGAVILEAGLFNGDEPLSPTDVGSLDRFGDSWSARATILPWSWLELQGSYAYVTSPEQPQGGGLDHRGWNFSARIDRNFAGYNIYGLIEAGRVGNLSNGLEVFHFNTVLGEAAVRRGDWQVAARLERSDRPEEERTTDLFRSVRPATDNNILGTTRWTIATLQLGHIVTTGVARIEPFVELSRLAAEPNEKPAILEPANLYGSSRLWSFSAGVRTTLGMRHARMGRYGTALPTRQTH